MCGIITRRISDKDYLDHFSGKCGTSTHHIISKTGWNMNKCGWPNNKSKIGTDES
jgi:hypothetical protein